MLHPIRPRSTSRHGRSPEGTLTLDEKLGEAQAAVGEMAQPGSARADNLQRQFQDARGLNQLASAEVRMPKIVPGWLRKTVTALGRCPDIIRVTMSGLQTGTDIAAIWVNRWGEFKHESTQFLFAQFRKTIKAGERTADILEGKESIERQPETDDATGAVRADRKRDELQASVRRSLRELEKIDTLERQVLVLGGEGDAHRQAEKLRAEYQEKLLAAMRELADIARYLALHRHYAVGGPDAAETSNAVVDRTLGRAGRGLAQKVS